MSVKVRKATKGEDHCRQNIETYKFGPFCII